ncbi:MAG: CehA/McbA family metallohydrolase, partial [Pirellulaceae bacterium]|jgi:hypothetical protein|nr:CehA/McbA family metallohydrolase [Pirellulaceae bacterium]
LRRWIDMNKLGWYSGDTHVHLTSRDLRTFVQAEHLNVAFPLTGWVTKAYVSPESSYAKQTGQVQRGLIRVDSSHIIQPMNTEWEIFTVDGKRHTLGAIFAIGHKEPFKIGAPPVRPIAAEARRQGALLELDKHNWPWSMMLIPIADVDLFELSNNHIWRTRFLFSTWYPEYAAKYMGVEMNDEGGFTERGWIEFGFQNYYTLLNCGMRLRPTAGTASGVHPVPVGFGRVYVEQPRGFSYKTWMSQLNAGRSFVTTGPMLFVTANERPAGARLKSDGNAVDVRLRGRAIGDAPFEKVEVVVNGRVVKSWKPEPRRNEQGAFGEKIDVQLNLESSSWVAVRCFDRRAEERTRFAHSSPFHVEIAGRPLRPRKADTEYLMGRVAAELKRHANVLPPEALGEYAAALEFYRQLHANAVDE